MNVVNVVSAAATSVLIIASCSFFLLFYQFFLGLRVSGRAILAFDADITVFSHEKFFNYSSLLDTTENSELKAYTFMVSEKVAVQNESNTALVKMIALTIIIVLFMKLKA